MRIGNKIRKLRELKGLSQENMADALGMSVTGYGNIERNESDIKIEKLQEVSEVLGVNIEDIITFDEKVVFYNYDNTKIENQIGNYNFPEEVKKLYEDKVLLLEDKVMYLTEKLTLLENELKQFKNNEKD